MVAACEAVDGLGGELWRAGSAELEEVMAEADRMVAAGEAARVAVLAEVISRGEVGLWCGGVVAGAVGAAARAEHPRGWCWPGGRGGAGVRGAWEGGGQGCRAVGGVAGAQCRGGAVRGGQAAAVLAEEARPTVLEGLIRIAVKDGPRECRRLRPQLLAKYGLDGQLQLEQDAAKRYVALVAAVRRRDGRGRVPADPGPGGQGRARGRAGSAVGAAAGRRGARPALQRPPPRRGAGRAGAARGGGRATRGRGTPRASCSSPSTWRPCAAGCSVPG